jgi:hypothetical protein
MPDTRDPKCYKCGSKDVEITTTQQNLKHYGKNRRHVEVKCNQCPNVWWSKNKKAVAKSYELDKARKDKFNNDEGEE